MSGADGGLSPRGWVTCGRRAAASFVLAMVLVADPSVAAAQAVPASPPTREEVERAPVQSLPGRGARLEVEGGVPAGRCALDDPRFEEIRVTLASVEFQEMGPVPSALLEPAYAGLIGSEQPVSVLCAIRDRATAILNEAGYLAVVEIPEQSLADGRAAFRVVLGRLVAVRVRGDAGRSERLVAAYLRRLTEDEVFNREAAERYLLLAGDLPGYDVRLTLRSAGAGPGELVGEVAVLHSPATLVASVQNYGSEALGRFGGLLSAELYGLTGLGDRTTLTAFTTLDFDEQQTLQLGHDFRIGSDGLVVSAQVTGSWGRPETGLADVDVDSETLFATLQATYPFLRTRQASIRGSIGFDLVDQDVDFNDAPLTRDRLRVLFGRLTFDSADPDSLAYRNGYSPAEPRWAGRGLIEVRHGVDVFGASPDCRPAPAECLAAGAQSPSRIFADPTATLVRYAGAAEFRPVPAVTIAVEARAQYSARPLLAFEEFSAGNFTIGRGYDPGAILGDSGIGSSIELRLGRLAPMTRNDLAVQPYVFVDVARVWNEDPGVAGDRLASAGGGLRALWGDRVQADMTVAIPLERVGLQADRGDVRFLFTLTTKLLPWSFR
ncbi:ShlB/FhaC/HecB family hemolysin secretion/activation protein [Sphingosinicella sp. CPCC 101087]|uniref:ShlB/FhaC/HecB family hemolysin secretion/activation protein n=1 Tax=Sphingosinicella sp. CPCC 101087 TaxID=2497754 RepID=UPI00101CAFA7|nr:ShlB/FhaC/HecB family hemolysin secretion/activation protein [Sphingosinicella sp. CPCC 101087]